ncbi:hypothetical protein EDB86DRAFT_2829974 [Lactarius hatsudake]|nr:hypothetical protein EDB86DRAFT_2829974 [Lactarius hatsudake]
MILALDCIATVAIHATVGHSSEAASGIGHVAFGDSGEIFGAKDGDAVRRWESQYSAASRPRPELAGAMRGAVGVADFKFETHCWVLAKGNASTWFGLLQERQRGRGIWHGQVMYKGKRI